MFSITYWLIKFWCSQQGIFPGSQRIKIMGGEKTSILEWVLHCKGQFYKLSTVMKEYFENNHAKLVPMCKAVSEVFIACSVWRLLSIIIGNIIHVGLTDGSLGRATQVLPSSSCNHWWCLSYVSCCTIRCRRQRFSYLYRGLLNQSIFVTTEWTMNQHWMNTEWTNCDISLLVSPHLQMLPI